MFGFINVGPSVVAEIGFQTPVAESFVEANAKPFHLLDKLGVDITSAVIPIASFICLPSSSTIVKPC